MLSSQKLCYAERSCTVIVRSVILGRIKFFSWVTTVSSQGISVDIKKPEVIANWPVPMNQTQLQSFLGLAGYYRRFIYSYATIALPFGPLVKKDHIWNWNEEHDIAFSKLKSALQSARVLTLSDFSLPFIVTTDASGYCVGGVLSQKYNGHDHRLAFLSKTLGVYEQNWPTHEKELYAIKLSLKTWRHYLYGRHFDIYTDNSACQWLLHHPKVSSKLARFLTYYFAQFDFTLHHLKGPMNVVADTLSRHPMDSAPNALISP
ncbi:unnamed protein product [Phytophthora fragariaefolia]|uniref:Unnamed protein product n=1 Tax=Phytophthora fragariaefolia TaxID=1490495 RepID=A0A9W6TU37_9STRA|nr:unnamed protein product [Phytophthora fragariaefolia]